jgi:hypothetical protein
VSRRRELQQADRFGRVDAHATLKRTNDSARRTGETVLRPTSQRAIVVICGLRVQYKLAATLRNYREKDTATAIPRLREYAGCTLTFGFPPEDGSNLMCGFDFAASIVHPITAPIPV